MWLILIVLGLGTALYACWNIQTAAYYLKLQTDGVSAPAVVTYKRYQRGNHASYYYVDYLTEYKGNQIKSHFVFNTYYSFSKPTVGQTIAVRFLPEAPDQNFAILNTDLNRLPAAINWEILSQFGNTGALALCFFIVVFFTINPLYRQRKVLERGVATVGYVQSVGSPPTYTGYFKDRQAKGPYRVSYRFITTKG